MNERVRNAPVRLRGGIARTAILLAFGLGTLGGALASPQSFNYRGTPLLTGGVTEEEREAMKRDLGPYNVWIAFAERDTGNYVTGVKVAVVDSKENAVIDTVSDGPWLLAQVPPGQYKVRMWDGQEQAITVGTGTPPMTVLRLARQP